MRSLSDVHRLCHRRHGTGLRHLNTAATYGPSFLALSPVCSGCDRDPAEEPAGQVDAHDRAAVVAGEEAALPLSKTDRGGEGPGSYDCSGLVQAAWRRAGLDLPRTTWEQWSWGASRRVPLDLNRLQPGDLLFSKGLGHMGMYAGGGKMVYAPPTGDIVKVVDLDDYWWGRLLGAVRP
ncbi:C40 family peptidase [Streptosporangium sp. CA-135522]|uniref:C40 family peptidase n=1 Tax=Streptosporangium sp. CA-135522 TaxID=3240072 RepID=UPI003D8F2CD6